MLAFSARPINAIVLLCAVLSTGGRWELWGHSWPRLTNNSKVESWAVVPTESYFRPVDLGACLPYCC